jgi:hypothetical protein
MSRIIKISTEIDVQSSMIFAEARNLANTEQLSIRFATISHFADEAQQILDTMESELPVRACQ